MSFTTSCSAVRIPLAGHSLSQRRQASVRAPRSAVVVRAEEKDAPKLSFRANDRAGLGFTEADSAGQTNIFAVEPKTYVEGSSRDDGSNSSLYALGAFMIASTILAGTVTVLTDNTVEENLANYKSLAAYKAEFAAEVADAPSL